jgi:hypothetical protein
MRVGLSRPCSVCTFCPHIHSGRKGARLHARNITVAVSLNLAVYIRCGLGSPNESMTTPSETPTPISTPHQSRAEPGVPEAILSRILNQAAKLANVSLQQLVIVRADAVIWNDGSLGCPEPGMQYAQALVNGYWVIVSAAGQTYDFRARRDGSFRICPQGRGHPPLPSHNQ